MLINQRKAGVILNYLSEGVKIITALVYTPLMLRLLGQSEYGLYQLVSSTVSYLSLLSLGFGSAYVRYFSRYKAQNDDAAIAGLNGVFMSFFCIVSFVCLLCGSAMANNLHLIFGDGLTGAEITKAKVLLVILIINMAITFPNSVFSCYVTAHERFIFQKVLLLVQGILNPFLALPLLLMGYGSVAVVTVTTVLTVASFVSNILFCIKKLKMKISFTKVERNLIKEIFAFTFFIFLNQIIDQVNWNIDKLLLGRMSGTAAVAIYGIGGQINSIYVQASISVSSVFVPKVNHIVAETNDNGVLLQLMIKVGRIQFMIIALVLSGFLVFGQAFIRLWAGSEYAQSYWVAAFLMVAALVPLVQNIGIEIQRAKNKHRARSVVYACLAMGNLVLSIPLIQRWGSVGAAMGTFVTMLMGNTLFMNWYYHHCLKLNMIGFWKEILKLVTPATLACVLGFMLSTRILMESWGTLFLAIGMYTLIYGAFMWFGGMNQQEKHMILGGLSKKTTTR